jgi:NADH-quinone oxidoreductase subunit C
MESVTALETLRQALPDLTIELVPSVDQPAIVVPAEAIELVARQLREHPQLQYQVLAELTAADFWPREPRFEIVYHFVSLGPAALGDGAPPAARLRVKARVAGDQVRMPTICRVYRNANWYEREVYDLFGVVFEGHPDLHRLLMPDDWEGHPGRKDYPVQIHKAVDVAQPLQVTEEDFVRNIERQRRISGADPRVQ